MMDKASLVKMLKEKGIQVTPQRLAIFERLVGKNDHPSAEMIYSELMDEFPSLTLVTVYNTLQKLESSGLCCKVNPLHNSARYDGNTSDHIHLVCTHCEMVADYHSYQVPFDLPSSLADDFEVRNRCISIFGVCKQCQSSIKKKAVH